MAHIGRRQSFGIGIESTPGTPGTLDAYVPFEAAKLRPMTENEKDPSGLGTINGISDAYAVRKFSELEASGIAYSVSFGYLLLLALGTVADPELLETGVYKHAFSLKNDNDHPSATVYQDGPVQDLQSTYHMLQSATVTLEVGNPVRYELATMGRGVTDTTGLSGTYSAEEAFLVSRAYVKFADDVAGLAAAAKVPVQTASFTFEKNLEPIYATATGATEALEFASLHNQDFACSGEFEMVYSSDDFRDMAANLQKKAVEITVEGRSLIGATEYASFTFRAHSVVLEEWEAGDAASEIVRQTFGFAAMYKLSEGKSVEMDLVNTKSSKYA